MFLPPSGRQAEMPDENKTLPMVIVNNNSQWALGMVFYSDHGKNDHIWINNYSYHMHVSLLFPYWHLHKGSCNCCDIFFFIIILILIR